MSSYFDWMLSGLLVATKQAAGQISRNEMLASKFLVELNKVFYLSKKQIFNINF